MEDRTPYLIDLNRRLREAAKTWPAERSADHVAFLRTLANADGGFRGRGEQSDLYYTAFAVRALAMLDALDEATAGSVAGYLQTHPLAGTIDLLSQQGALTLLGRADAFAAQRLELLRCDDGGYAKTPGGTSSTYHTFLAALVYDLQGQSPPALDRIESFVRSRRRSDGGFAELAILPHSSVNPTAAAVALLIACGQFDTDIFDGAASFLIATQRDDGGWPASPRSPRTDLLSTFTAMLTLADLGSLAEADLDSGQDFVTRCRKPAGGFGGAPDDIQADAEYTFYGLAASAIGNFLP